MERRCRQASLAASCPSKGLKLSLAAALLTLAAACHSPEGGNTYEAWFRPLSGFCPRYVVGEEYAWIRGKVPPGYERKGIRQQVFSFRGEFLKDAEGNPRVSSKCQGRPYPIFQLHEVMGARALTSGEKPPGAADAAARSGQLVSSKAKEREAEKALEEKLSKREFGLPAPAAPLPVKTTKRPRPVNSKAVTATVESRPAKPKLKRKRARRRGGASRLKSRSRRSR